MRPFIAEQAMDDSTCRLVQSAMDAGLAEPAEVLDREIVFADDVRRATHIEVPQTVLDLVEACLDGHRAAISRFFQRPLRSREGASLLRYAPGGFYRPHIDRGILPSWPLAARRQVTVVLFLASSRDADPGGRFTGGVLRLFPGGTSATPVEIVPVRGRLVAFSSSTLHEVTPVLGGTRDTVVDWLS